MAVATYRFGALQDMLAATSSRQRLNDDRHYRAALFAELDARLDGGRDTLSLDIFDTLLLRDESSEIRRFWEIGGLMTSIARVEGIALDQPDAFLLRYLGTAASYRASPIVENCREGCLADLHRTASSMIADGEQAARLQEAFIAAEIGYEASRVTPATAIVDYVYRHRELGGRVVLITDMYMRERHVRALLAALDLDCSLFDLIVSSADTKISKWSGGVFQHVESRVDRPAAGFVHVGDNLHSDFMSPIAQGWRAVHLPIATAERRARRVDHFAMCDEIMQEFGFAVDINPPD